MPKPVSLCFLLLGFASCGNYNDREIMKTISGSLDRSRGRIVQSNEYVYRSLDTKLKDPVGQPKAAFWGSKIQKVKVLSMKLYRHLDSLKTQVRLSGKSHRAMQELISKESVRLYSDLLLYCDAFSTTLALEEFTSHPTFYEQLKKDAQYMLKYHASLLGFRDDHSMAFPVVQEQWISNQFGGETPRVLLMLNKLQSDVLLIERSIIGYCLSQIPVSCNLLAGSYWFRAFINSTHVKAGQKMEIVVGEVSREPAVSPRIRIADSSLRVTADGTATYSFIAKGKPGVYSIPVKISYTGVDGQEWTVVKNLEYIIAQ